MNYLEMKNEFNRLKVLSTIESFDATMDFIGKLNSSNDNETLEFHYSLLKNKDNSDLYYRIRAGFKKRGKRNRKIVKSFLLKKLESEKLTLVGRHE